MKFFYLVSILFSSVFWIPAAAQAAIDPAVLIQQLQENLPSCAFNCMVAEVPRSACALTDTSCICTDKPLADELFTCLSGNCTVVESLQTQRFQAATCGQPVRDMGDTISGIMWAFFVVTILAVTCRGIARLPQFGGKISWDDYTIFVCLLTLVPAVVFGHLMINHGLGRDIWMLTSMDITLTLKYFYIELYLYCFLVTFTKLSILLLYLRIFTDRAFQWKCYILIALTVCMGISSLTILPISCRPIRFMWEGWDGSVKAKCINMNAETFAYAAINMALDILIFLLPIPSVLHLQMHWRKKLGVALMFAVGLFVTICSIVRLPTLLKWSETLNPTYDYARLAIWSLLEMMFGVICACFPGIAAFIRRFWPKVFGTVKSTYKGGASGYTGSHQLHYNDKSGSGLESGILGPRHIYSKTTVSVKYTDRTAATTDANSTRSDELELTPHTAYRQHESYTRYSAESDPVNNARR